MFPDSTDKRKAEIVTETFFLSEALACCQGQLFDDRAERGRAATYLALS